MAFSKNPPAVQPTIVKTTQSQRMGIHSFEVTRCAIGYVLEGSKFIYTGDERREAGAGDIFFLNKGVHFVEETPSARKPFEEIVFFCTPEQLGRIVSQLNFNLGIDVRVRHSCPECKGREHIISTGWSPVRHFFEAVDQLLKDGLFARDPVAETLKLTELVYHIVSRPEGCLRTRILGSTDPEKEFFERTVYDYIYSNITLEELAAQNNRSLTSFKKAFRAYFNDPPHRWVVHQRLMNARMLLISTNKPIAQIGSESCFPNTSHFIKLFRKEFGITPAQYRRQFSSDISKRTQQPFEELEQVEA
ncbi:MAG: AraC family transcriptional regulator [Rikenellaceae bacterium]|jgi:AraC-like DNA-binding protein|nr:AraC family transcriptional regulator [Rikenellaceae bacterium]